MSRPSVLCEGSSRRRGLVPDPDQALVLTRIWRIVEMAGKLSAVPCTGAERVSDAVCGFASAVAERAGRAALYRTRDATCRRHGTGMGAVLCCAAWRMLCRGMPAYQCRYVQPLRGVSPLLPSCICRSFARVEVRVGCRCRSPARLPSGTILPCIRD